MRFSMKSEHNSALSLYFVRQLLFLSKIYTYNNKNKYRTFFSLLSSVAFFRTQFTSINRARGALRCCQLNFTGLARVKKVLICEMRWGDFGHNLLFSFVGCPTHTQIHIWFQYARWARSYTIFACDSMRCVCQAHMQHAAGLLPIPIYPLFFFSRHITAANECSRT